MMKELWLAKQTAKGNIGSKNSSIYYDEFISPSSNKLSVISITGNYLAVK